DGLGWCCELDLTARQVREKDETFRQQWAARGKGYLPVDVASYRAPRGPGPGAGADDERFAAVWVAAERRPDGGLAPLEFLDARMSVALDEAQHGGDSLPLMAAGFVPRTTVKVAGPDGVMRVSTVRWKLRNPPRSA